VIVRLNRDAFGGDYEAELIQHLRDDGLVAAALVAIVAQQIVGHVVFSWLPVTRDGKPGPTEPRKDAVRRFDLTAWMVKQMLELSWRAE
jgi:hypothetical protein